MWITNADRDLKILYYEPKEQELKTMPNIRNKKIKEIVLYLDDIMLADYDTPIEALREMEEIQRAYLAGQYEYQVKDYELLESDMELVAHLKEKYAEEFNVIIGMWTEQDELELMAWANSEKESGR